ncbi:phosphoribosyltransferase [Sphingobium sp. SCG-1]|nr:phosphoribosyltransferase [Sphingobium sp. SCG-1]
MTMPESPELAVISHDSFTAGIAVIAAQIRADDWKPDYLVAIGRGGLVPGAYLSHASGHKLLSVDLSTEEFGFSGALLHELAEKTQAGQRLLIVDDINDSGSTILYLRDAIMQAGGRLENIRIAVLLNNIRSAASVDYAAESIDRAIDKRWFVFPWEAMAPEASIIADAEAVPGRLA